jgi:hypothetical protein
MQIVPEQVLYSVFSNCEVIIGCNQEFLRGLKEVFPTGADSITADAQIGAVFTKMVFTRTPLPLPPYAVLQLAF